MKKFAYIVLTVVVVSVLTISSALAQAKKAGADQATTRITRDAAEQLVAKKYLGAQIFSCQLETAKGNSVWNVRFTRTGANLPEAVTVDAQTGKITRL